MDKYIPEKINWELPEYEHREKTNDWYWALGVIVLCGSVAAIIYHNYLFVGVLVIGGILMGYFAGEQPEMISYEINKDGFRLKNHTYPYKKIKSFFVGTESAPMLFIKLNRPFLPVIHVPIEQNLADLIRAKLLALNVAEEEMKVHASEHIMERIGF